MGVFFSKDKSQGLILSEVDEAVNYQGRNDLIGLNLSENVAHIAASSFAGCHKLASIYLPGVVSIGGEAFSDCMRLKEVYAPHLTLIGDKAFSHCETLETVRFPLAPVIGWRAFYNCYSLTHAYLPQAEHASFFGCRNLVEVDLASQGHVETFDFFNCYKLTQLSLLSVRTINDLAFLHCKQLTRLTLSGRIMRVEDEAFSGCTQLKRIIIDSHDVDEVKAIKAAMPAHYEALVISQTQSQELDELQDSFRKQAIQTFNRYCPFMPQVINRKLSQGPMSLVSLYHEHDFIQELNNVDIFDINQYQTAIDAVVERHISIYRLERYRVILAKQLSQGFFATCVSCEISAGRLDAVKTKALVGYAINELMEGKLPAFTKEQKILILQRSHLLSHFPRATIEEVNLELAANAMELKETEGEFARPREAII